MEEFVLRNARHLAADYMRRVIRVGDTVVDATMGNGHDTCFLAELVGECGKVYAFDVQPEAIESTRARVENAGFADRVELILDGHQHMGSYVPQDVRAIMFNLGWLPGAKHMVTTLRETTMQAVSAAIQLIQPGGIVTICIYPGHEEGRRELEALHEWVSSLSVRTFNVLLHVFPAANPDTPQLILIQKNK